MMHFLYNTGIRFYQFLIWVVSFRNPKAKKWLSGRKNLFEKIKKEVTPGNHLLWFHVSSLGEFEQARPVIEGVKKRFPKYRILLTFFSPSGYELKKDYPFADYVFYLPLDTPRNASKFLDLIQPEKVFFVKYEFWFNFLTELKQREIPTYIFSALFRPSQFFFQPWGKWFRKALKAYTHLFVQNQSSFDTLHQFGFDNVTISGDTRLDRVAQIAEAASVLPKLEKFCAGNLVIVAGSTWPEDEAIFLNYVNACSHKVKFVVAPHEVNEDSLDRITSVLKRPFVLYSSASTPEQLDSADVMIVDGYGYLVSVYRYAKIAFIGGGFTTGIHSILEPAVYGMPVVFGPDYHKFHEAIEMIQLGAAHSVSNYEELDMLFERYLTEPKRLAQESLFASQYVESNRGATEQIIRYFFEN
ncbi:MAG: 3-deoxy-D-manno-octulosonic acid transferase [Prolixibacteraceae bacterium]|nr:3-deoxy-D-manno-octulosonic acid transferase [Prolixibacteraceae bacterium]